MKDSRSAAFPKLLQQILSLIGDATRSGQASDDFALVVRDREFVERTHGSRNEQNDIARSHQHDVSTLQTKARVDDCVASVERQLVQFHMLDLVTCRRNTDMETAGVVGCLSNYVHDSSRRARKEHNVFCCDGSPKSLSFLDQSTARLQSRTLGRR